MPREDKGTCLSYFIFDQQPFEFSLKISNISKFPCLIFFFFFFALFRRDFILFYLLLLFLNLLFIMYRLDSTKIVFDIIIIFEF